MTNTANSKTLMRAQAVLCLLFTSLLVQCTCTSQFHTRRPGHIRHCYKDLFKSTGKLGERNDGGLYFRQVGKGTCTLFLMPTLECFVVVVVCLFLFFGGWGGAWGEGVMLE